MSASANTIPLKSYVAKIGRKGVVTIPVELRRSKGLNPGDTVCFELPQDYCNLPVHSVNMRICKKSNGIGADYSMHNQGKEGNQSE
jgi:bifunctional DNA-binding transcriptional regulator/antitoxin component of YhaV-PrlF toxin-antitoxin module